MNLDLSLNLSKEDLLGALKTIYLFLDGINFNNTSDALRDECLIKGYDKFDVAPKNIIVNPPLENSSFSQLDKFTQTLGLDDEDGTGQLQSSIHSETETKALYYKEPFNQNSVSSKEILVNGEDALDMKPIEPFLKSKSDPSLNLSGKSFPDNKKESQIRDSYGKEVVGYDNLKERMRLLEEDYKKLMDVTMELTAALQTHIMGQSENLNAMLNKCKSIYPELFQKPEGEKSSSKSVSNEIVECSSSTCPYTTSDPVIAKDEIEKVGSPSPEIETIEKNNNSDCYGVDCFIRNAENSTFEGARSESDNLRVIPKIIKTEPEAKKSSAFFCHNKECDDTIESFELNYDKLKADLVTGDCELQLAIVVALRQKIINSDKDIRNSIINSYVKNDLLNILPLPNATNKNIVEALFVSDCKDKLQEETSRLVNTVASLKLGREYLCRSKDFLNSFLIPAVKGTYEPKINLNSTTEDMLIATVQKLSLKYPQRECMINAELTEYLLKFLSSKYSNISRYCLEYATALFMNLCLHRSARDRLRSNPEEVVDLLGKLLNTKYEFCMPYVNGAIYSLLSDEVINEEARRQDFYDLIRYHIQQTDGELRSELEHIIKVRFENTKEKSCVCDSSIEPEFEVDILDPELDNGDNLLAHEDILLKYKKTCSNLQGIKCLGRPATPLERSANKPGELGDSKKKPKANMSYNEESMQLYYTPTKNGIFNPQTTRTRKMEPSLFSKTICPRKKDVSCSSNCFCNVTVGKTTPYIPDNTVFRTLPVAYNVPVCYRDNYDHFKAFYNSKESTRYSCNCLQLVSQDVEFDFNNRQNKSDNNVNRYHFCPKCQKHHQLDESNIEMCNRNNSKGCSNFVKGGVINFSFKELSETSGDPQPRPTNEEAPCYDIVFQSRPRILRTPP